MDLQDVFDKALSEYFNEAHKIIFNCSFISRLENGKSVTTSSILSDTVKATNDDMQGIITRAEAAEKEPSLWPIRKARDPLREPAFDIQVAKNKHEQWWKGSVGKSILPDIGKRTAGVLLTFQRMCDGEQVISDEGDLKVLAEEETGKDATDIATSLARILKKQACLTDSVVTE